MITVTLRLNLDQILDVGVDGPVSLVGAGGDVHVGLDLGQVLALLVLALQGYTVGVVGVSLLC